MSDSLKSLYASAGLDYSKFMYTEGATRRAVPSTPSRQWRSRPSLRNRLKPTDPNEPKAAGNQRRRIGGAANGVDIQRMEGI